MSDMKGLSVIVPVYNEKDSVKDTLTKLQSTMARARMDYEILLVDDGSTDGTRDILQKIWPDPKVKMIYHRKNKGYGAALKSGIKTAKFDFIFISDCDGTYPVERIPELAAPVIEDKCDMMVGARTGKDAQIPLIRRPAKWFILCLANYLTDEKIPDLNSGFRCIKKSACQRFLSLLPDGFSFTTTITIAMLTSDYRVEYNVITYKKRTGKSKIHPVRDTINFIKLVIRTVLYFNPLKIFLPLTGILLAAALIEFLYSFFFCPKIFDDTLVALLLGALQIFAIGLIADLIDKRVKEI